MKFSQNRWASVTYIALAVVPIGMLLVLLQFSSPAEVVEIRSETWVPINLSLIGVLTFAAAVVFFPNTNRTARSWLLFLSASVVLAVLVGFLLSWVTAIFYLSPVYFIWRSYREASSKTT